MNKSELISVIVPVYQVEKYLRRCIESILMQSYTNLEVILVDDGSFDSSGTICDEYAEKYSFITVIHKKNEGQSEARNCGLRLAKGNYITFVDSDDYLDINMLKTLYECIKKYNTDIAGCYCYKTYKDKLEPINGKINCSCMNRDKFFEKLILEDEACAVWGKLYTKECFRNVKFEIGKYAEDELVMLELIKDDRTVSWINECLYFYNQEGTSLTRSNFNYKKLDRIEIEKEWLLFSKEINEKIYILMLNKYFSLLIDTYSELVELKNLRAQNEISKIELELEKYYDEYVNTVTHEKIYSIKYILIKLGLFKCVKKIKHIL